MYGARGFFRPLASVALLVTCVLLAGCGSGDGFDGGAAAGPLQPTFSSIQANVFTPICEQCHSGAGAPFGLRLDAANSYALLVGVSSGEQSGLLRVKAGDPNNSYLVQKLEGRASTGERMPAGLPPLPQATIDVIRQWITNGALMDAPQSTAPIRVTSLSPLPSAVEPALPASITVAFDRASQRDHGAPDDVRARAQRRRRSVRQRQRRVDYGRVRDRTGRRTVRRRS